jgi:hypothetical protein
MKFEDNDNENLNNALSSKGVAQGYEMCIFCQFVNNHQNCVFALRFW